VTSTGKQIPDTASIDISAQTGGTLAALLPATPLVIAQATKSTDTGPTQSTYDIALIDTGSGGTGAFNTASSKMRSAKQLRITVTLNPGADKTTAPRLAHWKVQYDCQPAQ
jgi:hypothetical protein